MQIDPSSLKAHSVLSDACSRTVTYLRLSLTDRCNYRCAYCMPRHMHFLPRTELLSFAELDRLTSAFIDRGVRQLRLTGGEPLMRRGIIGFIRTVSRHLASGALDELTMTTNGAYLAEYAADLAGTGMRRINVSLDTLRPERFRAITRRGSLDDVLGGIDAALAAGLHVKINVVAMAGVNDDELVALVAFAHARGMDISFIETMPLGDIGIDRAAQFLSADRIVAILSEAYRLQPIADRTAGPASYLRAVETGGRIGLIGAVSRHFCASCNKVRVSCTGQLFSCLGSDRSTDLRAALRAGDNARLGEAIEAAIRAKPEAHAFDVKGGRAAAPDRPMSVLGG